MQQKKSYVGPRGWAMLTLVGGTALASPFFLPPDVDVEGSVKQPPASHAAGLARLASIELPGTDSSGLARTGSAFDLPDLSQQILPAAGTALTELPAWAPVRSPIDNLISQGTAPAWQSDSAGESTIKPLTPWINGAGTVQPPPPLSPPLSPPAATIARAWPDASSLPVADHRSAHSGSASAPVLGSVLPAATGGQGSVGNLTSTAQTMRASTTPRLRPPERSPTAPAQRQFVYQPGFSAPARLP